MKNLLAMALIGVAASQAMATASFFEVPGDLNAPMNTYGNPNADLNGVTITNDASNLIVSFTTNSPSITSPDWIKVNLLGRRVGLPLDTGANGNGWGRAYNLNGGGNIFVGGWVDGGGGGEARAFNGSDWSFGALGGATYNPSGMTHVIAGDTVTYTIPLTLLGLAVGDSFVFNATTTGGTSNPPPGDNDGAWDPLDIQGTNITAPAQASTMADAFIYTISAAPGTASMTGNLTLNDTIGAFASDRNINIRLVQAGRIVAMVNKAVNSTTGTIEFSIPAGVTGAATLEFDGASFLKRKQSVNLTGSSVNFGLVAVQNGDSDNSGEVDAADIDLVIADFGGTGVNTDVDASGEVDAADIDIVIANFGGFND